MKISLSVSSIYHPVIHIRFYHSCILRLITLRISEAWLRLHKDNTNRMFLGLNCPVSHSGHEGSVRLSWGNRQLGMKGTQGSNWNLDSHFK